jgi:excisionase family DNA binding protein
MTKNTLSPEEIKPVIEHLAETESLVWNVWPDVGKRLNLSKTTTWKMIHTGQIPSIRLGKRYVVPKAALEKVLDGGWQPPKGSR